MKKDKYVEMNIDEMKEVKDTWQIHLRIFIKRLRHIKTIESTPENKWELLQLEESLAFCVDKIKQIISIHSELINLGENCEWDEAYFLKQIKQVQVLHKDFRTEANKKSIAALKQKFNYAENTSKPTLNY